MNERHLSSKRAGSALRTVALHFAAIAAMLSAVVPARAAGLAAPDQQQSPCRKIGDYSVCGRFIDEWSKQGSDQNSVYVNGLPITAQRAEISVNDGKTYQTQWFERAKYELHPENKPPYDVLLGRLGGSLAEGRGIVDPYTKKVRNQSDAAFVGIDKPADADGKAKVWFPETKHSVSGKILEYWNRYGGLPQFGFPLSEQFQEISDTDGKSYTVQYFERNRFELHPENKSPYEVQLGLLGVQHYRMTPVAGSDLPAAPPPGVKSSKDTLVIGAAAEPPTLSADNAAANAIQIGPLTSLFVNDNDEKGNVFGQLAWYAPTLEKGGARFVGIGEDRHLQVKYKLRPGMKWSDGVEITSNDFVFAYKTLMDPDFPYDTVAEKLYNIDNPDKYTVIANFLSYAQAADLYNSTTDKDHFYYLKRFIEEKKPVTDPAYYAAVGEPRPEHSLASIPVGERRSRGYYSDPSLMVTSGPFKVDRWDHGVQLVLVQNPYYKLTAPPLLNKVVYRFLPDRDIRIAQLKTGDVDVLLSQTFPSPDAQLQQLEQAGIIVTQGPGVLMEQLTFNLDSPFFKEKVVRQAMAYAVNRQKIARDVSGGRWSVLNTLVPPMYWTSIQNPNFPDQWKEKFPANTYPYDPAKANQMLDQAGWIKGPDGIRAKGGVRLSFRYDTTANAELRTRTQAMILADLKAVGIDARTSQTPSNDFFDALGAREFDLAEFAWALNVPTSGGNIFESNQIPSLENDYSGDNTAGYRNARFDELSRAANTELERSKQYAIQAEMQAIYAEDLPSMPLFTRTGIEAHKPNLMNWDSMYSFSALGKIPAIYFK